jgi:hypothetical protein
MILKTKTDSPEAIAAISAAGPKHVWIHGVVTFVYTGEDIPDEPEQI